MTLSKKLQKFVPANLNADLAGKDVYIGSGTTVFDLGTKRKSCPKYRVNTLTRVTVLGTAERGWGEYAKTDYVAVLPADVAGGSDKLIQWQK